MKQFAGCLCCLAFLYMSQAHAQVPAVLGVWEFDKQASTLFEGFPLASEVRSYELNGQANNRGTRSISADGNTMTIDVTAIFPGGREVPFLLVFRRL